MIKWKKGFDSAYVSIAYDQVNMTLSESQAEMEELNQSQSMGTCIMIGLSFRFCFRVRQSLFLQDRKRRSDKWNQKKMETFWYFWLRFRRAYDCLQLQFLIFTGSA